MSELLEMQHVELVKWQDRALKAEAANREKDAEIEGLNCQLHSTEAELARLRASGEKWIDVKKELPPEGQYVLAANTFNNRQDLISQHVVFWEQGQEWFWFNEDARWVRSAFGFWQPLAAPPLLPKDKE